MIVRSLALALLLVGKAAPAAADVMVARSPAIAPDLGKVVAGSSATSFSVTIAGTVTRTSGNAIRLSTSSVTTPTITITCTLTNFLNLCALRNMLVTIQPVIDGGPASVTLFRVGALTGTTYRDGAAPAPAASMSFVLTPMGLGSISFKIAMDAQLAASAAAGHASFGYTVSAVLQ